jgi:hypothetical protein
MINSQTGDASPDWRQRVRQIREQQWTLAQQLLASVRRTLAVQPHRLSPAERLDQADRLLRLAARLGRISTQFSAFEADRDDECPKCCAKRMEMETAVVRIYGQPLPGEQPEGAPHPEGITDVSVPSNYL